MKQMEIPKGLQRSLLFRLLLTILFGLSCQISLADKTYRFTIDGIMYQSTVGSSEAIVISRYKSELSKFEGEVVIPSTVISQNYDEGVTKTVVGIMGKSDYGAGPKIETPFSIILPNTIKSIGEEAFYMCPGLKGIDIPESVTSIGEKAFMSCTSLNSVSIPEGVTSIGNNAFCYCTSLNSVSIPEGVTSIGYNAFSGCTSLNSVSIPESVTSIGSDAFNDCTSLDTVTIPTCVTSIASTFPDSPITTGAIANGATIVTSAFKGCTTLTSFTIPNSVKQIATKAFDGCTSLTSIALPEGLTSIGSNSFSGCTSLASIALPEGLTSLGSGCFSGCTSLASIALPEGLTSLSDESFYGCISLSAITLPENMASIGMYAFSDCSKLTEIDLTGVSSIGSGAFSESGLEGIFIPATISVVPSYAFSGCGNLATVRFSSATKVTSIGTDAFRGCAITSVKVPATVTSLGYSVFADCSNLRKAEFLSDVTFNAYTFEHDNNLEEIVSSTCYYDGFALYNKDKTTLLSFIKDEFDGDYTVWEGTTEINAYGFYGCTKLSSVTLPAAYLETIGAMAFYGCSNLCINNLPTTIKSIDDQAFVGCGRLPESLCLKDATIGYAAFKNTEGLKSVELENTTIGKGTFEGVSSLTSLSLTASNVPVASFSGLGLKTVNIGDSCTLGDYAFADNKDLTSVSGSTLSLTGYGVFSGCTSLASVPQIEGDIPGGTFRDCSSLQSVACSNCDTIAYRAFKGCKSLRSVGGLDCNKVLEIGQSAFDGCESLVFNQEFLNVNTVFGDMAFKDCKSLKTIRFRGTANIEDPESFADNTTLYVPKGTGEHYQALLPKCKVVEDYECSDLSDFNDSYFAPDYKPLVAKTWVGENVLTDVSQLSANYVEKYEGPLRNLLNTNQNKYFLSDPEADNPDEKPHYIQIDLMKGYKAVNIKMTCNTGLANLAPTKMHVFTTNTPEDESSWLDMGVDTLVYVNDTATVNVDHYDKVRYVRLQVEATASNTKSNGNLYFALSTMTATPYQGRGFKSDDGINMPAKIYDSDFCYIDERFLQGKQLLAAVYGFRKFLYTYSYPKVKDVVMLITKSSNPKSDCYDSHPTLFSQNRYYGANYYCADSLTLKTYFSAKECVVDTFKIDYKYRNDTIGCCYAHYDKYLSKIELECQHCSYRGRYPDYGKYQYDQVYVIKDIRLYARSRKRDLLFSDELNEVANIEERINNDQFVRAEDYQTLKSYAPKMDERTKTGRWVDFLNYDYCTFYADYPAVLPDSVKAGIVTAQNGELVVDYIYKAGDVIPANTGVIIKGNCRGNAYVFEEGTTDATSPADNLLHGTVEDEETYVEGCNRYYMLSFDKESDSRLGFYWNDPEGPHPFVNKAYKAYLALPSFLNVAKMNGFNLSELEKGIAMDDGGVTGIDDANNASKNMHKGIYSIDGRQIKSGSTKNLPAGVYIINGRKQVVM